MHLSPTQCKRFYRLFYSLLDYANRTFGVLGERFDPYAGDLGAEQVSDLVRFVFGGEHAVISRYARENPDGLSDDDIEQVACWDEALFGQFVVAQRGPAFSAFLADGWAFNVAGLTKDVSEVVRSAPAMVETVLLPFERHIVYGVNILEYPVDMGGGVCSMLSDEYTDLLAKGRIATSAEELMLASPLCKQRRARCADEERRLQQEGDASVDAVAEGTHRGALAGLDGEQRQAALEAHVDEVYGEGTRAKLLSTFDAIRHAPVRTIPETLSAMTRERLLGICRRLGISGYSKLRKAELAEGLAPRLAILSEGAVRVLADRSATGMLELGRKVYEAGGMLEMSRAEHDALPRSERMRDLPPILNVFEHAGKLSCVMPDEVMAKIEPAEWERAAADAAKLEHARHLADTYAEMCGVVAVDDLAAIYARYYPGEYTAQEFEDFLLHGGPDAYTRFDYWTYGGVLHIVDFDLIGEDEDRPGFDGRVRIDGDRIAAPGEDERFRRYLHARHSKVEPWEVASKTAEELEGFDLDRCIAELPSYLALRSFLDGHVPDGEDDYFFANKVLTELVDVVRDEYEPGEIVGSMQEWGIGFDSEAQVNKVLELMMNLANDIPIRSNNGWSPNQMLQREMAGNAAKKEKKVFYDASGKPRKVGRNEPCPCGSGKKYKRCCGR